jgi:hypothetical protein
VIGAAEFLRSLTGLREAQEHLNQYKRIIGILDANEAKEKDKTCLVWYLADFLLLFVSVRSTEDRQLGFPEW